MRLINNKLILIAIIFFILGAVIAYNISKLQQNSARNDKVITTHDFLIDKYFPIEKGNFWEYAGTKTEDVGNGKVETTDIKKRVEILDIQEVESGKLITLGGSEPAAQYLINRNTIDFSPDTAPEAKVIWTFPLYVGQKFGSEEDLRNRNDNLYVEFVEEKMTKEVKGKKYDECFKITYKGLPDTSYRVFCYGLGFVEESYKHNGTVLEWTYTLTDFRL